MIHFLIPADSLLDFLLPDVLLAIFFDMFQNMVQNFIVIEGRLFSKDLAFSADAVAGQSFYVGLPCLSLFLADGVV